MAKLRRDNDHIERRQFAFQFEPKHSASAGEIKAFGVFDHQTFIQTLARLLENLLNFRRRTRWRYVRSLKLGRQYERAELFPPLTKRSSQERASVHPEKIENHKGNRDIRCGSGKQIKSVVLSPQPRLQIEEGQSPPFVKSDDFAVNNKVLVKFSGLFDQLRKLPGNSSQIARENLDPISAAMKLCTNPIEFVFNVHRSWDRRAGLVVLGDFNKAVPDGIRAGFGSGEHAFNRTKH